MITPSFRYHLVDHADGRQTIAVYSLSELAEMFSTEGVAFLAIGKPVMHSGKRHTDMVAYLNANRTVNAPRATVIDRMRRRLAARRARQVAA